MQKTFTHKKTEKGKKWRPQLAHNGMAIGCFRLEPTQRVSLPQFKVLYKMKSENEAFFWKLQRIRTCELVKNQIVLAFQVSQFIMIYIACLEKILPRNNILLKKSLFWHCSLSVCLSCLSLLLSINQSSFWRRSDQSTFSKQTKSA